MAGGTSVSKDSDTAFGGVSNIQKEPEGRQDMAYYPGTSIGASSEHIKEQDYKEYSRHSADLVSTFLSGKFRPDGSEVRNGVSRYHAVESAFFRLGYRIDMLCAYDAHRDVELGKVNSVLKSDHWNKSSFYAIQETNNFIMGYRILRGEKLENIRIEMETRELEDERFETEQALPVIKSATPFSAMPSSDSSCQMAKARAEMVRVLNAQIAAGKMKSNSPFFGRCKAPKLGAGLTQAWAKKFWIETGVWRKDQGAHIPDWVPEYKTGFTKAWLYKLIDEGKLSKGGNGDGMDQEL